MAGRASRAQGSQSIKVFVVQEENQNTGSWLDFLSNRQRQLGIDERGKIIKALLYLDKSSNHFDKEVL